MTEREQAIVEELRRELASRKERGEDTGREWGVIVPLLLKLADKADAETQGTWVEIGCAHPGEYEFQGRKNAAENNE